MIKMETEIIHAIQDEYPDDFAQCFGCGRLNDQGYHFRTGWYGDQTKTIYTPHEEHTAIPGFVYGGFIASLVDCHGTGSASLALHRENGHEPGDGIAAPRFVTASLKVNFIKPTPQHVPLIVISTLENIHPKRWKVHAKVYADGKVCATGEVDAVVKTDTFGN